MPGIKSPTIGASVATALVPTAGIGGCDAGVGMDVQRPAVDRGAYANVLPYHDAPLFPINFSPDESRIGRVVHIKAAVPSAAGGTLAAQTYYYQIAPKFGAVIGAPTEEVSAVTTGATGSVALTWDKVPAADGYRIFCTRGASGPDRETVYFDVGDVATFTDTGAAGTAGKPLDGAYTSKDHAGKRLRYLQTAGVVANDGVVATVDSVAYHNRTGVSVPTGKYLFAVEA